MILITIAALSILTIITLLYAVGLFKVHLMSSSLKKMKGIEDISTIKREMYSICEEYKRTATLNFKGTQKTLRHANEFFNTQSFSNAYGINLKHIAAAPGAISGLGVLGTFLGLTISVMNFDSSTSNAIMGSIKELLNGMGTAFSTSLVGMSYSAIYIAWQKFLLNKMERRINVICSLLDSAYYIPSGEVILEENKRANEEMAQKFQELKASLMVADEEGGEVSVGNMMLNLYEESEKQSQALESFTTDLSNELNASLGKTMNASIVPLIQNLERSHETMNTRIEDLSNSIQSPATDFVTVAIKELQSSMLTMTNEFRDTISGQTIGQMEALANNLAKTGEMMNVVPETIKKMSDQVSSSFADVKNIIQELQTSQQRILPETMKQLTDKVSSTFHEVNTIVEDLQTSVAGQQARLLDTSNNATQKLIEGFQTRFEQMAVYQKSILDEMSSQLKTTVGSLTAELSKVLSGISVQQNNMSDVQTRTSREMERLLQSFAQSISNMQNANQESTDMLLSIKKAGDTLNNSTNKLNELSIGLGNAAATALKQQSESVEKFESLQEQNQEVIEELSSALESAQKLLTTYSKDFETIKAGLNDVFKGINEGLKDYSATLRESTGGALAEYSDAMTKSTTGLKNIADALAESAEELTDGIDKLKKMR